MSKKIDLLNYILNHDQILEIEQAANFLNISIRTIQKLARDNKIPLYKTESEIFFFKSQITRWKNTAGKKELKGKILMPPGYNCAV